ncbi:hypothetical protein RB195_011135 [Necator americanus]|uniref:Endonuclease/exonuclease/phosphatase domain-containing protein n=1 Tax=Necator americanus TaxID=51031 RepID=A0ABR1D127_NECAM
MASLKDEECRSKFRQRVSIHVGVRTWKKLCDAESFTKCIQDAEKKTLAQKIDAPTRFRSILDVVLSSGSSISDIEILTPFDKSDHIVVSFKFDFNTDQIYLPMPDFSCVNYSELRKFLARVDWLEVFDNCQSIHKSTTAIFLLLSFQRAQNICASVSTHWLSGKAILLADLFNKSNVLKHKWKKH